MDTVLWGIERLSFVGQVICWGILGVCVVITVVVMVANFLKAGRLADEAMDKILRNMPKYDKQADE